MYKEYLAGSIASAVQTLTMHPLDTLKVYNQSNIKRTLTISGLYQGMKYPLSFDILAGSLLFGTYYNLKKKYSSETSSIITGIVVGTAITPFEVYKIKCQLNLKKRIPCHKGIQFAIIRESIGNYVYFGTYDYLSKEKDFSPGISGGISGGLMWTVVYPIDYVKTNYVINKIDVKKFVQSNYRSLYKGYKFCLLRAIPANIIIFEVYEAIIRYL